MRAYLNYISLNIALSFREECNGMGDFFGYIEVDQTDISKGRTARSSCCCIGSRWIRYVRFLLTSVDAPFTITGILTALTQPNPDALRKAIRQTRQLTSKPFGVNLTILPAINPPDYEGFARAAVEEGVKIFETAGSNRKLC